MTWKLTRCWLAAAVCLAVVAGARADDEKTDPPKKKIEIKVPPDVKKCLDSILACGKAVQAAAKHCNEKAKEGEKNHILPLRWQLDCLQTLQATANVLVRQGPGHKILCEACARVCEETAKACKEFDDDEMKECAKACLACAKACREMAKGPAKKEKKEEKKEESKEEKKDILEKKD